MLGVCCPVFDRDFVLFLRFAKFVVGVYKNSQHRFQRFLTPEKTSALASQSRYVMSQIRIAALYIVRVALIL